MLTMIYGLIGSFFSTKIGRYLGFVTVFLAVLAWIYLSGRKEGASDLAAKQAEETIEKLKRMKDANANVSRNRDDVSKRLRDGKF